MRFTLILLTLLFLLPACRKSKGVSQCFMGKGKTKQSRVELTSDFHGIRAGDKIDLVLLQDTILAQPYIKISGYENLMNNISADVDANGILEIKDNATCNWVRNLQLRTRVEVYFSSLDFMEINGFCKLIIEKPLKFNELQLEITSAADMDLNLSGVYFILDHRGLGEITVSGNTDVGVFSLYNVAGVDARNMLTDWGFVYSYSNADVWIKTLKGLGTYLHESGNLYYLQEPWDHLAYIRKGEGKRIYIKG